MVKIVSKKRERILRNYRGGRLACTELLRLLETRVAPGAESSVRALVDILASRTHWNLAAHTEGSRDGTRHYTVMAGRGYHLRLDRRGVIFQVTVGETGRNLGPILPWSVSDTTQA